MVDKTITFKSGLGRVFDIKVIDHIKQRSHIEKQQIISDIRETTKRAWADPNELAEKWFKLSDIVLFAAAQGNPCGFALGSYIAEDILFLPATVTVAEAQSRGLAVFLNGYLIRNFFLHMVSTGKRDPKKITEPFYIVFWTANPLLYYMVSRHIELFPSPQRSTPTDKEKEVVRITVEQYSQLLPINFNEKKFIDIGCDLNNPNLIYDKNRIPWSRDKKINDFFEDNLELTKRKGNNFVITGKIALEDLLFKRV